MRIKSWNIHKVQIPFIAAFNHHLAKRRVSSSIILEICTENGIRGYGECTPRQYVTGETLESAAYCLRSKLPEMRNISFSNFDEITTVLDLCFSSAKNRRLNARCAMELAFLDALGKEKRLSALHFVADDCREEIFYSGVLSASNPVKAENMLHKIAAIGFKQVKLKVGRDVEQNLENVRLAQAILGPEVEIRTDANAAWGFEEALENIHRFYQLGIQKIEQPLPVSDRKEYPRLMAHFDNEVDIIVDESVCTFEDAEWFVKNNGTCGFNLKIAKHGGLVNTMRIYDLATENGLSCQLGCHVGETSILTAAGMLFTGYAKQLTAIEGAYGQHLLENDITDKPLQFGRSGMLNPRPLLGKNGLGIDINFN